MQVPQTTSSECSTRTRSLLGRARPTVSIATHNHPKRGSVWYRSNVSPLQECFCGVCKGFQRSTHRVYVCRCMNVNTERLSSCVCTVSMYVISRHEAGKQRTSSQSPIGRKAGREEVSFLLSAPDQTRSMALAEREKPKAPLERHYHNRGKNLKGAEWQYPLFGSFPSAQIYSTPSRTISHSGCSARVISRRVCACV